MTVRIFRVGAPTIFIQKVIPMDVNNAAGFNKEFESVTTVGDILEGTLRSKSRQDTQVLRFSTIHEVDVKANDKVDIGITYPPNPYNGEAEEKHIEAAEVVEIVHHLPTRTSQEYWDYSFEFF